MEESSTLISDCCSCIKNVSE